MNGDNIHDTNHDHIDARARAAADELIASFADLDTEAALIDTLSGSATPPRTHASRTRWIALAAAVVLIVGGTIALAATRSRTTSHSAVPPTSVQPTIAPPDPPAATTVPVESTLPATATTAPTATVPATTDSATATTTTSTETLATAFPVSYLNPPPVLHLQPLATISVPAAENGGHAVAIGDNGVVVGQWPYADEPNQLDAIGFDGVVRNLSNVDTGAVLAYGPGDVAYLTRPGTSIQEFAVVAIPLSGDNAGTIVATAPANVNHFVEYPPLSFGHGTDGVIHRREFLAETLVAPYSDSDGSSVGLNSAPATFSGQFTTVAGGGFDAVITSSTGAIWSLEIDAAPDRANTYVGDSPPAPSANGTGIYVTHIGPNAKPTADFGEATMWVMAHLQQDGSATWWSLPDGWRVVASDIWGTVLAKHTGTQLELALADLDSSTPCPNPPAFEPTTLPAGMSDELRPGDGGQITIGANGEIVPVEPVDDDVFHYAGPPGAFVNIQVGASPGLSGTASETVSVLGGTARLTDIEDGFKAEISQPCGAYTIVASGISREDFRAFLEGLVPR